MAHLGNILFAGLSPLADILKHCYGLNAASYWSVVPPGLVRFLCDRYPETGFRSRFLPLCVIVLWALFYRILGIFALQPPQYGTLQLVQHYPMAGCPGFKPQSTLHKNKFLFNVISSIGPGGPLRFSLVSLMDNAALPSALRYLLSLCIAQSTAQSTSFAYVGATSQNRLSLSLSS